jgi:hypothetical protein
MQNTNNDPVNREQAIEILVAEAVENKIQAREAFTALDISNDLKRRRFPVRHSEISPIVRDIWDSGAMGVAGYDRRLIDVYTSGGTAEAQAFLYLPNDADPDDYDQRIQDALPPVSETDARDLLDSVATYNPQSPLISAWQAAIAAKSTFRTARRPSGSRGQNRVDGALPIPRTVARQAGWKVGDTLVVVPDSTNTNLTLAPMNSTIAAVAAATVRVWADLRIRVSKTKLRLGGSALDASQTQVVYENGVVRVAPRP